MGIFSEIEKYGKRIAVITEEAEYSYQELVEETEKLASKINGRCLAFIVCSNTYSSLVGYVSFLRNNIVPLMINSSLDTELFANLIETYRPQYVWQPHGYSEGYSVFSLQGYELIKLEYDRVPLADELALLLTTSGSTGSPKYVMQSYKNIESNALSIIEYLGIVDTDRAITTLPMSYTYGLSIINSHLLQGASIVLTEATVMQREFWSLLRRTQANNFGGVPYTYEMLNKMHFERSDLSTIRYLTQAGGRLGKELHEKMAAVASDKGFSFVVMYGQTEATARMSWLPWDKSCEKIGSIGIAIPGGKFTLVDDEKREITDSNVVGELVYQGPNVTMGYASGSDELIHGDQRGGVLETGDMAYRDSDGFYYIAGRKKRFLKVYGNRINLDEVDAFLAAEQIEAVAAGEDDHVKIYAVNAEPETVRKFVSAKTGLSKQAFEVVIIDKIPRNDAGKILYKELQ